MIEKHKKNKNKTLFLKMIIIWTKKWFDKLLQRAESVLMSFEIYVE